MRYLIVGGGLILIVILGFLFANNNTKNYQIGVVLPLSGDGANAYGMPMKKAIATAIAEINAKNDLQLEAVYVDGKCTEEGGKAAAKKLVDAGIKVILGGACSSETLGIASVVEPNKVLLLNGASGSSKIADAGDYVYRIIYSNAEEAKELAENISNNGYTRVGLLLEDNANPFDMRDMLLQQFAQLGITASYVGIVDSKYSNLEESATKLVASKPDAVITLPQTSTASGLFADALVKAGIGNTPRYTSDVGIFPEAIQTYPSLDGYIGTIDEFPGLGTTEYTNFEENTDCTVGIMCVGSYDGVHLLADIIKGCGGTNPECMRNSLDDLREWKGSFLSPVTFDQKGEIISPAEHEPLYQVKNGTLIPLTK